MIFNYTAFVLNCVAFDIFGIKGFFRVYTGLTKLI
jgi:hypothetical protein